MQKQIISGHDSVICDISCDIEDIIEIPVSLNLYSTEFSQHLVISMKCNIFSVSQYLPPLPYVWCEISPDCLHMGLLWSWKSCSLSPALLCHLLQS